MLSACTPKMDWRDIREEGAGWKATFPGKPVEVTRKLTLKHTDQVVTLTLKSTRIDDVMYAVGWITDAHADTGRHLQEAMLANITAKPDTIRRTSAVLQDRAIEEIEAQGLMRLDPMAAPVEARLWMRTLAIPVAGPATKKGTGAYAKDRSMAQPAIRVLEIIVVGPTAQIREEDARHFIDSFQLL